VTFDPPIDLTGFPLGQPVEAPDGGRLRPPDTYEILVVSPGPDGGPAPSPTPQDECAMLRVSSARDFGLAFGRLQFSITTQGPEATVTCSGEGQSSFDLDELAACPDLAPLMPHVEVDSNPGSGDAPGWVRLRVVYPPSELEADGTLDATKLETVEYFNCDRRRLRRPRRRRLPGAVPRRQAVQDRRGLREPARLPGRSGIRHPHVHVD
jgi:hypothetical protein